MLTWVTVDVLQWSLNEKEIMETREKMLNRTDMCSKRRRASPVRSSRWDWSSPGAVESRTQEGVKAATHSELGEQTVKPPVDIQEVTAQDFIPLELPV